MSTRMLYFRHPFIVFLVLLLCSVLRAGATTNVVILQDSFENPAITNATKIDPPGWVREHDYSSLQTETASPNIATPYGQQYMSLWSDSGIRTISITDQLQAGVTYTLTFHVGNANGDGDPDPTGSDYTAQLLAGTNVLASKTGTTDSVDFSVEETLTYTSDGTSPHLGELIGVRLAHGGTAWGYKTVVDNVKLVADESASEWKHTLHIGK